MGSKKSKIQMAQIAKEMKAANANNIQQQAQMNMIAGELNKANTNNQTLIKMIGTAKDENSKVQDQSEDETLAKERWKKFAVALQKEYNKQQKLVQQLIIKNKQYVEQLDKERNLSLLQRIQLAIESEPTFENEIRAILGEAPTIQRDFQRVFHADVDDGYSSSTDQSRRALSGYGGPRSVEYASPEAVEYDGARAVENDEPRTVECDSVRVESDSCGAPRAVASNEDGFDFAMPFVDIDESECDDDTLESSVAIAYVLSKMQYQK